MGVYEKMRDKVRAGKDGHFVITRGMNMETREYGIRDLIVIEQAGNRMAFYLWGTAIVQYRKDAKILTLRTGGWKTKTTQDRMNDILHILGLGDYRVCGKKETYKSDAGIWYIEDKAGQKIEIDHHTCNFSLHTF